MENGLHNRLKERKSSATHDSTRAGHANKFQKALCQHSENKAGLGTSRQMSDVKNKAGLGVRSSVRYSRGRLAYSGQQVFWGYNQQARGYNGRATAPLDWPVGST